MSELKYSLVKIPATIENIAAVVRDDINGATIVVSSGEIAVQLKVVDLVRYVNEIETAKDAAVAPVKDGVDFDKAPVA